ncbi:MAG TPA: hypothetical protein VFK05_20480 [Polyangiaceae bacterium]|nr:hypothetical protein [Polyangiaceae bacterium]
MALLGPSLLFAARAALAQVPIEPTLTRGGGQLEAQAHFGVATTPFDVTTLPEAKGQAFVLFVAGRYALSQPLTLELQVPFVLGSVAQPAGSYVDTAALANPQLGVQYRLLERGSDKSALTLTSMLELGAPLASHATDLMPNRVLAIADGIEGRTHPEWFTPGVLPITAAARLTWSSPPWSLMVELKFPLLVRVSEADLPSDMTSTHGVGFATNVGGEARYRLSRKLSLAAATHLFFDVAPVATHASGVSRVQDFERLSLHLHFGTRAALVFDLQTAIFGELGGSMVAGGLRAGFNFR